MIEGEGLFLKREATQLAPITTQSAKYEELPQSQRHAVLKFRLDTVRAKAKE